MATLFVNRKTITVSLEDQHLVIKNREVTPCSSTTLPLESIDRAIIVGVPSITFPALSALIDRKVPCAFLSASGYWRGMMVYDKNKYGERRKKQYDLSTIMPFGLYVSKEILRAKCYNSLRVIQRLAKNRMDSHFLQKDCRYQQMRWILKHLHTSGSLCALRGLEGIVAMYYFDLLKRYLPQEMAFSGRMRRPPKDPINALLSWGYALLLTEVSLSLYLHGLDYSMGYLHANNNRSPALALDLMEPFRATIDLLVADMVNHHIIQASHHFNMSPEKNGLYLNVEGRKIFFTHYEQKMQQAFLDLKTGKKTTLRQAINQQVLTFLHYLSNPLEQIKESFFLLP